MIWLKRVALALAALLLTTALSLSFLPKERLCNALLERLAQEEVTLCFDARNSTPLGCEMQRTTLLFAHSPVAKIRLFSARPWRIEADGILLEGMARNFLPSRIARIFFEPLAGNLYAEGAFGKIRGKVDLLNRRVKLVLEPSATMRRDFRGTLRAFRQKDGKYLYEAAF